MDRVVDRISSGTYLRPMAKKAKGHVQQLPSGSFRVKVYAGTDPVTGKERLLRETCPDYPSALEALVASIVSAALSLAKRYKWIDENPAESATMPSPGEHEPDPGPGVLLATEQASVACEEAWRLTDGSPGCPGVRRS